LRAGDLDAVGHGVVEPGQVQALERQERWGIFDPRPEEMVRAGFAGEHVFRAVQVAEEIVMVDRAPRRLFQFFLELQDAPRHVIRGSELLVGFADLRVGFRNLLLGLRCFTWNRGARRPVIAVRDPLLAKLDQLGALGIY